MEIVFSILVFSVVLVNGWTDAPSAIAGCVCTRSLSPRSALISVVIFSSVAAVLGLPTSESHALIAAMSGSALASNPSLDAISFAEWRSVIIGILVSTLPVLILALLLYRLTLKIFSDQNRRGRQ